MQENLTSSHVLCSISIQDNEDSLIYRNAVICICRAIQLNWNSRAIHREAFSYCNSFNHKLKRSMLSLPFFMITLLTEYYADKFSKANLANYMSLGLGPGQQSGMVLLPHQPSFLSYFSHLLSLIMFVPCFSSSSQSSSLLTLPVIPQRRMEKYNNILKTNLNTFFNCIHSNIFQNIAYIGEGGGERKLEQSLLFLTV